MPSITDREEEFRLGSPAKSPLKANCPFSIAGVSYSIVVPECGMDWSKAWCHEGRLRQIRSGAKGVRQGEVEVISTSQATKGPFVVRYRYAK